MFYPKLTFPTKKNCPFFYTNFVTTVDGKVSVSKKGYWPIGSRLDYQVLLELRAYADCLIHGRNLYKEFGDITKESLKKTEFKALRKQLGKNPKLPYIVASHDLKALSAKLYKDGLRNILVEGGPTLLGSFIKEGLMDEIFLTITPKIYGSEENSTKTLVEGILLPPDKIVNLKLLSYKSAGDELFLRYKLI